MGVPAARPWYPQYAAPKPTIDPRELRPARAWYVLAGVLGAAGIVAGGIAFARGFASVLPFTDIASFPIDERVTFELDPDDERQLYAMERSDLSIPDVECSATAAGRGDVRLEFPSVDSYAFDGEGSWVAIYDVEVTRTGAYTFECNGFEHARVDDRIGLGPPVDPLAGARGVGFGALYAMLGVSGGVAVGLIVGIRRSNHKRRLVAERPPPGPPPMAPMPFVPMPSGPPSYPPAYGSPWYPVEYPSETPAAPPSDSPRPPDFQPPS